jgi:hypothetical protein
MTHHVLNVDPLAGTHIRDAINDAKRIAAQLDVLVSFSFNGFTVSVAAHTNTETAITEFDRQRLKAR